MSSYYAQAFKTGTYPPLQEDKIFLWARPHPREANAPDRVPRPNNAELVCSDVQGRLVLILKL